MRVRLSIDRHALPRSLLHLDGQGCIRYASPARVMGALGDIFNAPDAIQKRALDELRKAGWEGLPR